RAVLQPPACPLVPISADLRSDCFFLGRIAVKCTRLIGVSPFTASLSRGTRMPRSSLAAWSIAILLLIGGSSSLHADDWPQWRGPQRDGVWRETGIVEKFTSDHLPIVWRAPVGPGYSGPTVAD